MALSKTQIKSISSPIEDDNSIYYADIGKLYYEIKTNPIDTSCFNDTSCVIGTVKTFIEKIKKILKWLLQ